MEPRVFLIAGPPGAGKTTVARLLAARAQRGLHVPVDDLREWVIGGIAHPETWTEETERQFELAERAAADVAARYAQAGFRVFIDHVAQPVTLEPRLAQPLAPFGVVRVVLLPSLETVVRRNAERTNKKFDVNALEPLVRLVHPWIAEADWTGWHVLDTSDWTEEETCAAILRLS